ncbi:MAG: hypothetical protein H8D80_02405 [Proteobacteria bacterium]|nr:hypothetical protein [Pseudomonadota bacterium]
MKNLIMTTMVFVILTGCEIFQEITTETPTPEHTSSTIVDSVREQREQTDEITNASGVIGNDLETIDDQADSILNDIALVPDDHNYNIDPTLESIEDSAETIKETVDDAQKEQVRIDEALEDLEQANNRVSAAVGQIEQLEDLVKEYEQSDREVRKEALEKLYENIVLFFTIGFAMIVGGAFVMFWVSRKLGATLLGIGFLTVGFAAASQFYMEEIAQVGLYVLIGGFLLTLFILGFILLNGKNNEKAMVEIIQLVEAMKDRLSEEERKEIFGQDGVASKMTSNITKNIISKVKIKNGWDKY